MSEQNITPRAQEVYDTVCRVFDKKNWSYEKEEGLQVSVRVKGDHMPIIMIFTVDSKREALTVTSPLPFQIPEDKIAEATFAVCAVMNTIFNGSYVFDLNDGSLIFRAVTPFMGGTVSDETVNYLLNVTYVTVNAHNDLFHSLGDGRITIEQFLEEIGALNKDR